LAVLACCSGPLVDADRVGGEAPVEAPACAVAVPTAGWLADVVDASPASRSLPRPARDLPSNTQISPTTSTASAARVSSPHQARRRDAASPSLDGTSSAVSAGAVPAGKAVAVGLCELSEVAVTVAVVSGAMGGLGVASGCCAEARARRMACAPRIWTGAFKAVCNLDVRSGPVAPRDPDETVRPTASAATSPAVGATVCRLRSAAERSFALPAPRLTPATRGIGRARPAAAHPAPCFFGNSPPADSARLRDGGRLSRHNLPLGAPERTLLLSVQMVRQGAHRPRERRQGREAAQARCFPVGPGADLALPVVKSAADQDDIQRIRFLYDPAPIVKTEETRKMKFLSSADRSVESRRLREVLLVRNPSAIACQSVIVYDE
jgi:hypothetical protein